MKINLAHIRERSTTGTWIDFVVFDAKSTTNNNSQLLSKLTLKAKGSGLKVDQSALAYLEHGRLKFFGDKNLIKYLSNHNLPAWTHTIDL